MADASQWQHFGDCHSKSTSDKYCSEPATFNANITPLEQARIVVDLDRPTPWQIAQGLVVKKPQTPPLDPDTPTPKSTAPPNREWTVTLDGIADPVLIQRYTPLPPHHHTAKPAQTIITNYTNTSSASP